MFHDETWPQLIIEQNKSLLAQNRTGRQGTFFRKIVENISPPLQPPSSRPLILTSHRKVKQTLVIGRVQCESHTLQESDKKPPLTIPPLYLSGLHPDTLLTVPLPEP